MIKTEDYKREFLFIIFARKELIMLMTGTFLAFGLLVALLWPPTFVAHGSFLVKGKKVSRNLESLEQSVLRDRPITKADLNSEMEILTSTDVATKTVIYLKEKKLLGKSGLSGSPEEMAARITGNIKSEVIPSSNVLKVWYYAKQSSEADVTLKALMAVYIRHRMGLYAPKANSDFFSDQVKKYRKEVGSKTGELMLMSEESKIIEPAIEIENNLMRKKELQQARQLLSGDAIELSSEIEHLEDALNRDGVTFFSFIENAQINSLADQLQTLVVRQEDLMRDYMPESHQVRTVTEQVNKIFGRLKKEVELYLGELDSKFISVTRKLDQIETALGKIDDRNVLLKQHQIQAQTIETEKELLLYSFETFFKRNEEASINNNSSAALTNSYVTTLTDPVAKAGPVFPRPKIIIPLSFLVGLLTGFGFAFFVEYFDHTFKKANDVENYAGVPLLFSMSYDERFENDGKRKKVSDRSSFSLWGKRKKKKSVTVGSVVKTTAFIGFVELALLTALSPTSVTGEVYDVLAKKGAVYSISDALEWNYQRATRPQAAIATIHRSVEVVTPPPPSPPPVAEPSVRQLTPELISFFAGSLLSADEQEPATPDTASQP